MIVSALIASTKALKDAIMLSLLGFSMFSLLGNQLFQGSLRQKCVYKPPWVLIGEEQLNNCSISHERLVSGIYDFGIHDSGICDPILFLLVPGGA